VWRLRRIPAFEAALMAYLREETSSPFPRELDEDVRRLALAVRTFLTHDYSGKLSRYQTSLQRQFSALLKELREMQNRRREEEGQSTAPALAKSA
jgi:hypothetical protein